MFTDTETYFTPQKKKTLLDEPEQQLCDGWDTTLIADSVFVCVSAGVCGRQPPAEELEGHRHLSAGDRGGLLAHHHVRGGPHPRCVHSLWFSLQFALRSLSDRAVRV